MLLPEVRPHLGRDDPADHDAYVLRDEIGVRKKNSTAYTDSPHIMASIIMARASSPASLSRSIT
jgi:hypothetical protein